jgi:hypothetical protein
MTDSIPECLPRRATLILRRLLLLALLLALTFAAFELPTSAPLEKSIRPASYLGRVHTTANLC